MKKSTKQFITVMVIFVLLLIVPAVSFLISERRAALDISAQGGSYDPVLPMYFESCSDTSASDMSGGN